MASGDALSLERWWVVRGPVAVSVECPRPGFAPLLPHVLGNHATLSRDTGAPAAWTIAITPMQDYARQREQFAAKFRTDAADGLSDYWRGDFEIRRLGRFGAAYAVRHVVPFEGITLFEPTSRRISYMLSDNEAPYLPHIEHLVTYVMRVAGWTQRFVDVHAAFVRYRGKGATLIGPRQAGKTSLAMHLLARGGELLGSDMAQIRPGADGRLDAVSIPHLCRITRETIQDNTVLATVIGSAFDGNRDYRDGPLFSYGKYEMYDPALERVLGRRVGISAMALDAVLFPRFDRQAERSSVVPAESGDGARRLMDSIRFDRPLADWLPFELSDRERAEVGLERWLSQDRASIPAFDVHFGREPSLDWERIDAVFDGL